MRKNIIMLALTTFASATSLTVAGQVTRGLVASYQFDGTFGDSSGNGHHLISRNGLGFGMDHFGRSGMAASFDGVDDWAWTPITGKLAVADSFSLAFWYRTERNALFNYMVRPNGQTIVSAADTLNGSTVGNIQYKIGLDAAAYYRDSSLYFQTFHEGHCGQRLSGPEALMNGDFPNAEWKFIVTTFKAGYKRIYTNGRLTDSGQISTIWPNQQRVDVCAGLLRFGNWHTIDPQQYHGLLDDVRVYNRDINGQEVDSLYRLVIRTDNDNLGVNALASDLFSVSPSPAAENLRITFGRALPAGEDTRISICDASGRTVYVQKEQVPGSGQLDLPVSHLAAGFYFIQIQTAATAATQKFVKR